MNERELKNYLKKNLKLNVITTIGFSKNIQLILEDEIINEIPLGIFF